MEKSEEIQSLRAELLDLERSHRRFSLEESLKRLDKLQKRIDPLVAEHQQKMKRVEQEMGLDSYNQEELKNLNEETRFVTRLQMKFYKVQALVLARHASKM